MTAGEQEKIIHSCHLNQLASASIDVTKAWRVPARPNNSGHNLAPVSRNGSQAR